MMNTRNAPKTILLAVVIACLGAGTGLADSIHVPEDYPTIQSAVDAGNFEEIVVAPGIYSSVSLEGRQGLRIRGKGDVWIDLGGSETSGIVIKHCRAIVIEGIGVRNSAISAFQIQGSESIRLSGCRSSNAHIGVFCDEVVGLTLDELDIRDSQWDGIHAQSCSSVAVQRSRIQDVAGSGVYIVSGANNLIADNVIEDAGGGIFASDQENFEVIENRIERADAAGISIDVSIRARAINNRVFDTGDSGIAIAASPDTSVADNHVKRAATDGIYITSSTRSLVEGNKVKLADEHGISISESANARISGNVVDRAEVSGISIFGSGNAHVHDNKVTRTENVGYRVTDSPGTNLVGNREKKSDGASHSIESSIDTRLVDNSFSEASDSFVIEVPGDFDSLQLAVDAAQPGDVVLVSKGVYSAISVTSKVGVVIRGEKGVWIEPESDVPGIHVTDSRCVVIDRVGVRKAPRDGIHVSASQDIVIDRCRVSEAADQAIEIFGNSIRVDRCRLKAFGSPGALFSSSRSWLRENRFVGGTGPLIDGGSNWISENELRKGARISVSDAADNDLHKNDFKDPKGKALSIDNAPRTSITDNRFRSAGTGFTAMDSDDVFLYGNCVQDGKYGFQVYSSDRARLIRNTAEDVTQRGFSVGSSDHALIIQNHVKSSGGGVTVGSSLFVHIIANRVHDCSGGYVVSINHGDTVFLLRNKAKNSVYSDFCNDLGKAGLVMVGNKFATFCED